MIVYPVDFVAQNCSVTFQMFLPLFLTSYTFLIDRRIEVDSTQDCKLKTFAANDHEFSTRVRHVEDLVEILMKLAKLMQRSFLRIHVSINLVLS